LVIRNNRKDPLSGQPSAGRENALLEYADDIIQSDGMKFEKTIRQHGSESCFVHSVSVSSMSLCLARRLKIRFDYHSLVRGALLHDYFLYDWHEKGMRWRRMHGFTHAKEALRNAERDFTLNDIERDIIKKHMFPLTPAFPKYRETIIVTIADKICAIRELLSIITARKVFSQ